MLKEIKQNKHKENHTEHIIIKLTSDQETILKGSLREKTHKYRGTEEELQQTFHQNLQEPE